jgi:enoyl-CoA hydratase/carnithine racemase
MTCDIQIDQQGSIVRLALSRAPHNFFDVDMIERLASILEDCDRNPSVRVTILTSDLKNFCAGADFGGGEKPDAKPVYTAAIRLVRRHKPMIAALSGASVGGGLGLALTADLRVGDDTCWFQANFTRIGISAGFGISHTLPSVVGGQRARDLLITSRRIPAPEALAIGLLDRLAPPGELQQTAFALAEAIATNSPTATVISRLLLGEDDGDLFAAAVSRELALQKPLFETNDFAEGVRAGAERRAPRFADWQE